MSFAVGERLSAASPGPASVGPPAPVPKPSGEVPATRATKDAYAPSKGVQATPMWGGEPVNPPGWKPYVDRARAIGFNTFLAIGGISFTGVLGGIAACAFNPPLGLAIIAGSALVNAGAVGTMILLAREDAVAEAKRRPVVGAE